MRTAAYSAFDDLGDQTFIIRWAGRQEGPYPVALIQQKLSANEIGMLHEIFFNERWISLRDLKQTLEVRRRTATPPPPALDPNPPPAENIPGAGAVADGAASPPPEPATIGTRAEEPVGEFDYAEFFSEVFRRHPAGMIQDIFCVGGSRTTPGLAEIPVQWPRPWMFARILVLSAGIFSVFVALWNNFHQPNTLPGILIAGSFAIPISTLVLFFEVNLWRNVSAFHVVKLFAWGAVVGFFFALYLFELVPQNIWKTYGATVGGPIEEPAKLLTAIFVSRSLRCTKILNGLLIGAAVGAGFAAFESAGYGFNSFMDGFFEGVRTHATDIPQHASVDDFAVYQIHHMFDFYIPGYDAMFDSIWKRGLLAPFAHIAWTAITVAAWSKVKGDKPFDILMVFNPRFLAILITAISLHMFWNSDVWLSEIPPQNHYVAHFALPAVIAWAVVIAMIRSGIQQIAAEKKAAGLR